MANPQGSIGASWLNMGEQSKIPTPEERAQYATDMRKPLPEVRHKVRCRYERLFDTWRVTFSIAGSVLRECRFEHDHTLDATIQRGRGFTCLADRQAVELGMRQGRGMIELHLDNEQLGALEAPR